MAKTFTRTITSSIINACEIGTSNGEVVMKDLEPIVVENEKVSESKAMRLVKEMHGKEGKYFIKDIATYDELYSITMDDFLAHATKVI